MQSVLLLKHKPEFMKEMNFYIMYNVTHNQSVDSVIDRDSCDDPHVC